MIGRAMGNITESKEVSRMRTKFPRIIEGWIRQLKDNENAKEKAEVFRNSLESIVRGLEAVEKAKNQGVQKRFMRDLTQLLKNAENDLNELEPNLVHQESRWDKRRQRKNEIKNIRQYLEGVRNSVDRSLEFDPTSLNVYQSARTYNARFMPIVQSLDTQVARIQHGVCAGYTHHIIRLLRKRPNEIESRLTNVNPNPMQLAFNQIFPVNKKIRLRQKHQYLYNFGFSSSSVKKLNESFYERIQSRLSTSKNAFYEIGLYKKGDRIGHSVGLGHRNGRYVFFDANAGYFSFEKRDELVDWLRQNYVPEKLERYDQYTIDKPVYLRPYYLQTIMNTWVRRAIDTVYRTFKNTFKVMKYATQSLKNTVQTISNGFQKLAQGVTRLFRQPQPVSIQPEVPKTVSP